MIRIYLFIAMAFVALTTGCSSLGVEPWDRDLLSQKQMQFGVDALNDSFTEHIYFSKEGSSGGSGFSGGGCGCN